jgi:signal transduction histidine kinase
MTFSAETDQASDRGSRPVPTAPLESRVAGRLAIVGLIAVLTVLTGFAVVSALRTNSAASASARSTKLNDVYWQARYAVGGEESLERKYRLEPSREVGVRYSKTAATFVTAMQLIKRQGTPADRALAAGLLSEQKTYRQAIRRMFAAVDAGDTKRVLDIDANGVDPLFGSIETQVIAAADVHRRAAVASVRSLEKVQRASLIGTPIAFAFGLLLVAFFSIVLVRQSRRADAAREAELVAQRDASSALVASNQRLRELDQLKDQFVASVSHELRTPLTSILGYVEMVLDGESGPLTDEQQNFLSTVERNSNRLLALIGDLLDVSTFDPGSLSLDRSHHDLASIVSESVSSAAPVAETSRVALTFHASEIPEVEIDRVRLGQVIDNLLSNALKFTPPGGEVEVRLFGDGSHAVVEVADTGMGMSVSEQEHIFERFFRAKSAVVQASTTSSLR